MPVAKRLTAAAVFAAALFAAPEPASAQSGCELLYLQWEGCATECESYYENRVARAVCRAWCLVEYLYDYWTCESGVEASEDPEAAPGDEAPEESAPEPDAAGLGAPRSPNGLRSFAASDHLAGLTAPLAGARRAVFRRVSGAPPRCRPPTPPLAASAARLPGVPSAPAPPPRPTRSAGG